MVGFLEGWYVGDRVSYRSKDCWHTPCNSVTEAQRVFI